MAVSITDLGTNTSTSGATIAISTTGFPVPANVLIVVGTVDATSALSGGGVTDSASNAYTSIVAAAMNATAANGFGQLFYFNNNSTTLSSITYTKASAVAATISGLYITGAAASPLDTVVTASATGNSAAPSVASGTPTAYIDVLIGFACLNVTTSPVWTQASSWASPFASNVTNRPTNSIGGNQLAQTAKTYNPTNSRSGPWAAFVVGFKTTLVAPPPITSITRIGNTDYPTANVNPSTITVPTGGVPAGSLIVLIVGESLSNGLHTGANFSDTAGNTYAVPMSVANGTTTTIACCPNCRVLNAGDTISLSRGNGTNWGFAWEAIWISGGVGSIDSAVTHTATGTSTIPSVTGGAGANDLIVIGAAGNQSGGAGFSQDIINGWQSPPDIQNGYAAIQFAAGAIANVSGALTYAPTQATAALWSAGIVGFRALVPNIGTVWNPADKGANITLSTADRTNDTVSNSTSSWQSVRATTSKSSGKFYFECKMLVSSNNNYPGLADINFGIGNYLGTTANSMGWQTANASGVLAANGFTVYSSNPGLTFVNNDIVGIAVDLTAGLVWMSKNNAWLNSGNPAAGTGATATYTAPMTLFPAASANATGGGTMQLITLPSALTYTPPSGFAAWDPPAISPAIKSSMMAMFH